MSLLRSVFAAAFVASASVAVEPPFASGETGLITSFNLMNADTDEVIRKLEPGDVVNLAALPTRRLNIEAVAAASVGKVIFQLNGRRRFREESARPFALAGDDGGDFRKWTPHIGVQELQATPFLGARAQEPTALYFTVVDQLVERAPQSPRARFADPEPHGPADIPDEIEIVKEPLGAAGSVCRGFLNHENAYLTIVCSHELPDAISGKVLRPEAGGDIPVCEFLNTASPMITSCASSRDVLEALRSGALVVAIERDNGARSVFPVGIE